MEEKIIFTVQTVDGMKMPFRCDYKTDGNYWKAVYKWNEKIRGDKNG